MSPEKLLQTIIQEKATLKIITKTKNERFFIEKWIQHHLKIIGDGKLIIFDNMSDDQHVLDVYKKYKEHILLIKFNAYFDDVHNYFIVKDFYDAIGKSCDFFTVLDSDEYLYLYDDNNTAIHDTSILDYLEENKDCDFFAPFRLENIEKHEKTLHIPPKLLSSLNHGKSIIHTKIFQNTSIHLCNNLIFRHNFELPYLQYTKTKINFFINHLLNFNLDQRITANMNKIVARGLLKDSMDTEALLNLSVSSADHPVFKNYIRATQELLHLKELHGDYISDSQEKANTMTIEQNNSISFSNNFSQKAFQSLMDQNYLDIINYDASEVGQRKYSILRDWIER